LRRALHYWLDAIPLQSVSRLSRALRKACVLTLLPNLCTRTRRSSCGGGMNQQRVSQGANGCEGVCVRVMESKGGAARDCNRARSLHLTPDPPSNLVRFGNDTGLIHCEDLSIAHQELTIHHD
jgi:hypothetical protein